MGELAITAVPAGEARRLAELEEQSFVEAFGHQNDPEHLAAHVARAFAVDHVERQLRDPRSELWWVLDQEQPVAYLKLNREDAQSEPGLADGLEVEQVYVLATHQGLGLGRRLLEHATSRARDLGSAFVWLGVWEHNTKAIGVYERLGFHAFGEHTFVVGPAPQRDMLLRLDLDG